MGVAVPSALGLGLLSPVGWGVLVRCPHLPPASLTESFLGGHDQKATYF